ncbi:MAG TPA: 2OG-Fe(II) oxygenase family protein [Woeseiaceae bacterium]|nr:2OG-Fe(II) oxygenase family protein [Woeseiaceae bacterium]
MSFHLSSSLDRKAIFESFSQQGYAHIRNVLPAENAKRIHKVLTEKTSWNLAFNNKGQHIDLSAAQLAVMPKQSVNQLQQAIYAQARDGFQYCYSNYPIYDAYQAGLNPGHVLHQFYEWMDGTSDWRADWGGYLQLQDESGNVRRGLMPSFNTLNILAVPQKHSVSLVAPFAGGMRLSISGWLRYGDKPAPSG